MHRSIKEALEFYSKEENYYARTESSGCSCCVDVLESYVTIDSGEKARIALKHMKELENEE